MNRRQAKKLLNRPYGRTVHWQGWGAVALGRWPWSVREWLPSDFPAAAQEAAARRKVRATE